MTTNWCWGMLSGLCRCSGRGNRHENRPGILGPVSVETIKIYTNQQASQGETEIDDDEMQRPVMNSDGDRGSDDEPRPGPSSEAVMVEEDPDAIHAVEEGGDAVVVERSVEAVEVTEEEPKLTRMERFRALFSRHLIHRLRRLSDEALHNLNIPDHVQTSRRRFRITQIRVWREHEWRLCTCFTGGRRCCRGRRNEERAVHFGPEPNPNPGEENPNTIEEIPSSEHPIQEIESANQPSEENQTPQQ